MSDSDRDILRAIAVLIDEHERGAQEFRTEMDPVAEAIQVALGGLYDELRPTPPDPAEAAKIVASLSRPQRLGLRQIARSASNYLGGFTPEGKIGKGTTGKLVKLDLLETQEIDSDRAGKYWAYRPTRMGTLVAKVIEENLHRDLTDIQIAALRAIMNEGPHYRSGIVPANGRTGFSTSTGRSLEVLGAVRSHNFPHNGYSITVSGRKILTHRTEYLLEVSAQIKEKQP